MTGRKEAGWFSGEERLGGYKGGYWGVATIRTAPRKFLTKIMLFRGVDTGVYRRESRSPGKGASNRQGITARLMRGKRGSIGAT